MSEAVSTCSDTLLYKIKAKVATIAVIGLGFAGLPDACLLARSGSKVLGLDIDEGKIDKLKSGLSPTVDISNEDLLRLQQEGYLEVTHDFAVLDTVDCVVICVPTLLDNRDAPDLHSLKEAARSVAQHLSNPKLVVISSTVPPGTTRNVVMPILEHSGARVGEDFLLAFVPERVDPGNTQFPVAGIPRLVSGMSEGCRKCASALYLQIVETVIPVSSIEVAEMAKLLENTFRFVNIGLVNEMAVLSHKIGVDIWEVIEAADTKPFGFMRHTPGAGIGGACIPITPLFLHSTAQALGAPSAIIEAAHKTNRAMPAFVVDRLDELMNTHGTPLYGSRILVVGVTYKPGVPDLREAPAVKIMALLARRGEVVSYHDPFIDHLEVDGRVLYSIPLDEAYLKEMDAVLLITPHPVMDYETLLRAAPFILDTSNALAGQVSSKVVPL
jgi:UDP-N-acetyl-D-glucosamine dehydrogenase